VITFKGFEKGVIAPRSPKKEAQKKFEFSKILRLQNLWRGASVDIGKNVFIA